LAQSFIGETPDFVEVEERFGVTPDAVRAKRRARRTAAGIRALGRQSGAGVSTGRVVPNSLRANVELPIPDYRAINPTLLLQRYAEGERSTTADLTS